MENGETGKFMSSSRPFGNREEFIHHAGEQKGIVPKKELIEELC